MRKQIIKLKFSTEINIITNYYRVMRGEVFPGGSVVKNIPAILDTLIPGSRRSPGEGNSNPLLNSGVF